MRPAVRLQHAFLVLTAAVLMTLAGNAPSAAQAARPTGSPGEAVPTPSPATTAAATPSTAATATTTPSGAPSSVATVRSPATTETAGALGKAADSQTETSLTLVGVAVSFTLFLTGAYFLHLFVRNALEEPPAIETHWGGFGGGLGGLRVSPSLLFLVVALVVGAMAVMVLPRPRLEPGKGTASPPPTTAAAASAAPK